MQPTLPDEKRKQLDDIVVKMAKQNAPQQDVQAIVNDFAMSQYPRKLKPADVKTLGYEDGKLMGYSLRTDKYRYTIWFNNSFRSNQPYAESRIYAK